MIDLSDKFTSVLRPLCHSNWNCGVPGAPAVSDHDRIVGSIIITISVCDARTVNDRQFAIKLGFHQIVHKQTL